MNGCSSKWWNFFRWKFKNILVQLQVNNWFVRVTAFKLSFSNNFFFTENNWNCSSWKWKRDFVPFSKYFHEIREKKLLRLLWNLESFLFALKTKKNRLLQKGRTEYVKRWQHACCEQPLSTSLWYLTIFLSICLTFWLHTIWQVPCCIAKTKKPVNDGIIGQKNIKWTCIW